MMSPYSCVVPFILTLVVSYILSPYAIPQIVKAQVSEVCKETIRWTGEFAKRWKDDPGTINVLKQHVKIACGNMCGEFNEALKNPSCNPSKPKLTPEQQLELDEFCTESIANRKSDSCKGWQPSPGWENAAPCNVGWSRGYRAIGSAPGTCENHWCSYSCNEPVSQQTLDMSCSSYIAQRTKNPGCLGWVPSPGWENLPPCLQGSSRKSINGKPSTCTPYSQD
jgi:hypothetical protein